LLNKDEAAKKLLESEVKILKYTLNSLIVKLEDNKILEGKRSDLDKLGNGILDTVDNYTNTSLDKIEDIDKSNIAGEKIKQIKNKKTEISNKILELEAIVLNLSKEQKMSDNGISDFYKNFH